MKTRNLALSLTLFACGTRHLDVGHDVVTGGSGGSGALTATGPSGGTTAASGGDAASSLPTWPEQTGCPTDPGLQSLVGTWEGELVDAQDHPVEHLRLAINGASSQGICGSVTWGVKAPPPPADDPDAFYPSSDYWPGVGAAGYPAYYYSPIEGFSYTITESGARLPTVRLGTLPSEPWRSWCEIQTPIFSPVRGWACTEQPDGDPGSNLVLSRYTDASGTCTVKNSHGTATYSAFHCGACFDKPGVCRCDADACGVVLAAPQNFDLTLSDDAQSLSGPFEFAVDVMAPGWVRFADGASTFHLARVE